MTSEGPVQFVCEEEEEEMMEGERRGISFMDCDATSGRALYRREMDGGLFWMEKTV